MASREQAFEWDAGDPGVIVIDLIAVSQSLAGAAGRWLLGPFAGGASVLEVTGGDVVVNDSPKEMRVTLQAVDTLGLAGHYFHQAFVTPSGAEEFKASEGLVEVFEKRAPPA
jgi:hypothetical protein